MSLLNFVTLVLESSWVFIIQLLSFVSRTHKNRSSNFVISKRYFWYIETQKIFYSVCSFSVLLNMYITVTILFVFIKNTKNHKFL